jgi:hypothetical protein
MVLMVNNLTGFGAGGGGTQFAYITSSEISVAASSFNFGSLSLGLADPDRLIVVSACYDSSGTSVAPTSLTVGGVSATKLIQLVGVGSGSSIWVAAVPTGTTGNVTFTSGGTESGCAVSIYRLVGYQSAAYATATSSTGNPCSTTINVFAGGVIIAGVLIDRNSPGTNLWTNLTEDYDSATVSGSGGATMASGVFSSTIAGQSISNNNSAAAPIQYLTAVSMQPR